MHEAQCGRKESLVDWRWNGLVDGWLNRLAPAVGVLGLGMVRVEWGPSLQPERPNFCIPFTQSSLSL